MPTTEHKSGWSGVASEPMAVFGYLSLRGGLRVQGQPSSTGPYSGVSMASSLAASSANDTLTTTCIDRGDGRLTASQHSPLSVRPIVQPGCRDSIAVISGLDTLLTRQAWHSTA